LRAAAAYSQHPTAPGEQQHPASSGSPASSRFLGKQQRPRANSHGWRAASDEASPLAASSPSSGISKLVRVAGFGERRRRGE
ncbi:hypothetical protein Dimus_024868, partial [Dionaea muscipula]